MARSWNYAGMLEFALSSLLFSAFAGPTPCRAQVDMTGDGIEDVVLADRDVEGVLRWEAVEPVRGGKLDFGAFGGVGDEPAPGHWFSASSAALGVVRSNESGTLRLLAQRGDGSSEGPVEVCFTGARLLAVEDLDNDGYSDVVCTKRIADTIEWQVSYKPFSSTPLPRRMFRYGSPDDIPLVFRYEGAFNWFGLIRFATADARVPSLSAWRTLADVRRIRLPELPALHPGDGMGMVGADGRDMLGFVLDRLGRTEAYLARPAASSLQSVFSLPSGSSVVNGAFGDRLSTYDRAAKLLSIFRGDGVPLFKLPTAKEPISMSTPLSAGREAATPTPAGTATATSAPATPTASPTPLRTPTAAPTKTPAIATPLPPPSSTPTRSATPTPTPTRTPLPTATSTARPSPTPTPRPTMTATRAPTVRPTLAPQSSVASPPRAPAPYSLPLNAHRVSTSAELVRALAETTPRDIVLADGAYDNSTYFSNACGHRLYAEHLGKAVLKAGLGVGSGWCGSGNGIVRGLAFDVSEVGKTLANSVIHIWGNASGTSILDVTINGRSRIDGGIVARQPRGLVLRRIVASHFLGYGILVDANDQNLTLSTPVVMEDLDVSYVSRPVPLSSNGTAEACIWIGNRTNGARLRTIECSWMGVWTGTAASGSVVTDIIVDRSRNGVGLYFEHFTRNASFRRVAAGPSLKIGAICEWADPDWGSLPACENVVVEDSVLDTTCVGVYLDGGTKTTTVRRTAFKNQRWAGIGNHLGIGNLWDISGNSTSGMAPGAVPISNEHYAKKCYV